MIRKSNYRQMPWKNLKGVTAEIDRVPDQENYQWRLSSAKVAADGPFSSFPGFDRLLVVTEGAGLFLNDRRVGPLEPFGFSGDDAIDCRLVSGPVTDLGLIFDRNVVRAEMVCFTGILVLDERKALARYVFDLESGDTFKDAEVFACSVQRGVLVSVFKARP